MIAILASLFISVCSNNTNPASCGDTSDCCPGFLCASNGTCTSANQAIAACRCKDGSAPACECYRTVSGVKQPVNCGQDEDLGGNDNVWKSCTCSGGFEASLRLVFRWEPADRVHYRFAVSTLNQLSIPNTGISDETAQPDNPSVSPIRATLKNAMNQWSERDCGGGKKTLLKIRNKPDITLTQANQIQKSTRNSNPITCTSSTPENNCVGLAEAVYEEIKNVVGFLGTRDAPNQPGIFPSSGGVLAATPIEYSRASINPGGTRVHTGRILRARTWFNALDYRWRTISNGCAAGASNCFDLMTIAVHEFGHFIGYQHSSCAASVMFGTALPATLKRQLDEGDLESLCGRSECTQTAGYATVGTPDLPLLKNRAGQTMTIPGSRSRLQSCATDAECGGDPKFACINKEHAGFCQFTCTTNNDCPTGEACVSIYCDNNQDCVASQKDKNYKYCGISTVVDSCRLSPPTGGTTGGTTGGSGSTTGSTTGATTGSSGSTTGTTGESIPGQGGALADFCAPCGTGSDCLNGICLAASNNTKVCSLTCFEDSDCGDNGTCSIDDEASVGFCYPKNTACIDQQVAIRRQLNEACDADSRCSPGLVCIQLTNAAVCLEYCNPNTESSCSTDGYQCVGIDNSSNVGVCFKGNMKEGDSCIIPDTSLCGDPRRFLCAGTPQKNYLDAQCYKLCGAEFGECKVEGQNCALYPNLDFGVCFPAVKPKCLADIGQECTTTDDCASGACRQSGADSACTRSCTLAAQAGCPRGNTCLDDGDGDDKGYCWPSDDKVKPKATCGEGVKSGCNCHSSSEGFAEQTWLGAVVAVVLALRRRRNR